MELWLSETFGTIRQAWKAGKLLYQGRSAYQDIVIVETERFGKMLLLDGCVMTTERDEFVYHEMLTHPAMVCHEEPKSVCVVGGGDGGTVREVLRHKEVERCVLAEIDGEVIEVCRKFFPGHTSMLDDPRVEIEVGDGFDYLKKHASQFDVILSDSTDPIGPGEVLFTENYFGLAKEALCPGGIFVTQAHSPWAPDSKLAEIRNKIRDQFAQALWYGAAIPTYPYGWWSFFFASDHRHPLSSVHRVRQQHLVESSYYYTAEIHDAAFAAPAFLSRELALV